MGRTEDPMPPLPANPMKPVLSEDIPKGDDWGYQLKWDGVRMLARVVDGRVELFSRNLLPKNNAYPEVVEALKELRGSYLLDGEVIVFDREKQRPVFQKVLQRERLRVSGTIAQAGQREPAQYVLYDVLYADGKDWRGEPYRERHRKLLELFPEKKERYFVTDLYPAGQGQALWSWVEAQGWEGIVSKRLSSPYQEGKKHKDWFKRKTALVLDVDIVGYTFNEGRLASLVMVHDGAYFGRVSLGLNENSKRMLMGRLFREDPKAGPFGKQLPSDLKGSVVVWLERSFSIKVTGLEITDAGLLRHPKLVTLPEQL